MGAASSLRETVAYTSALLREGGCVFVPADDRHRRTAAAKRWYCLIRNPPANLMSRIRQSIPQISGARVVVGIFRKLACLTGECHEKQLQAVPASIAITQGNRMC